MEGKTPFAVCFSGHRPEKLPQGNELRMLLSLLYREIDAAIADGADRFYTGCARGIDLWAADMILHYQLSVPSLRLICVQPYPQQGKSYSGEERYHLHTILQAADEVLTIMPHYCRGCYQERNRYIVAHSQRLIAVVNDMHSGTGQTVRMAERAGLDVRKLTLKAAMMQDSPAHDYFKF